MRVVTMLLDSYNKISELGLSLQFTSHVVLSVETGKVLLNIGCRQDYIPGYVNIDIDPQWKVDLLCDARRLSDYYAEETVDGVFMCHCFPYLNAVEGKRFLEDMFKMLKPGGTLILQQPDQEIIFRYMQVKRGDFLFWVNASRGLYAWDVDEIALDKPHVPYQMSYPGWVLKYMFEEIGFKTTVIELGIPYPEPSWRDSIIVGRKNEDSLVNGRPQGRSFVAY
jgi:SAM-dependent methyltransferase